MEPTFNTFPNPIPKKKNMTPTFVVVGVLVVAVVVSYLILSTPKKTEEKKVDTELSQIKEPSPTPLPKIDKKTVKIQVQNGTGTPGQAGLVVKALTDAGYIADNIKTGNADKFDNSTTSITAKDSYDEIVTDIKDSLSSTFDKITVVSPNLGSTNEFDVIIVTGGKIFETATPTAQLTTTPTATPTSTPSPTPTP